MKNKPEFMIIGGDSRFSYMEKILNDYGFGVQRIYPGSYKADDFSKTDIFILPVPLSRDNQYILTPLSDEQFYLGDFLRLLPKKCLVAGGMISQELTEKLKKQGADVFDYYKSEALTRKNAEFTAEGTLGIIIENFPKSVSGLRCAVTGYGRCASSLCKKLSLLGADVTAAARSKENIEKAMSDGFKTCLLKDFSDICADFDVIINTVPARIISEEILEKMNSDTLLIEIASAPFGIDFDSAKKLGITTVRAGGLPGRTSPFSAGKIICDEIIKYYRGDENGN